MPKIVAAESNVLSFHYLVLILPFIVSSPQTFNYHFYEVFVETDAVQILTAKRHSRSTPHFP